MSILSETTLVEKLRLGHKLRGDDEYIDNIQFERDFSKKEREYLIKLVYEDIDDATHLNNLHL